MKVQFSWSEILAARGVGILLVVLGHIPGGSFFLEPVSVYAFHMPLFFFLAGMTLDGDRPLTDTLRKSGRSLLLYTWAWDVAYTAIGFAILAVTGTSYLWFQDLALEHLTTELFTWNNHHIRLFLVGWFLLALAVTRPLVHLLLLMLTVVPERARHLLMWALAAVFGWLGMDVVAPLYSGSKLPADWFPNFSAQVLVATAFALAGQQTARSCVLYRMVGHPATAPGFALMLYVLTVALKLPPLSMSWSHYAAGAWLHGLAALLGITVVLAAARSITTRRPRNLLVLLGQRSKTIMAHHLFAFAVLNLAFVQAGLLDPAAVSVFTIYRSNMLWPLYLLVGVLLPLAALAIGNALRRRLVSSFARRKEPTAKELEGSTHSR